MSHIPFSWVWRGPARSKGRVQGSLGVAVCGGPSRAQAPEPERLARAGSGALPSYPSEVRFCHLSLGITTELLGGCCEDSVTGDRCR